MSEFTNQLDKEQIGREYAVELENVQRESDSTLRGMKLLDISVQAVNEAMNSNAHEEHKSIIEGMFNAGLQLERMEARLVEAVQKAIAELAAITDVAIDNLNNANVIVESVKAQKAVQYRVEFYGKMFKQKATFDKQAELVEKFEQLINTCEPKSKKLIEKIISRIVN